MCVRGVFGYGHNTVCSMDACYDRGCTTLFSEVPELVAPNKIEMEKNKTDSRKKCSMA